MSGTVAFFNDGYSCGTDIRGNHPLQIGEDVNHMRSVLTGIKTQSISNTLKSPVVINLIAKASLRYWRRMQFTLCEYIRTPG